MNDQWGTAQVGMPGGFSPPGGCLMMMEATVMMAALYENIFSRR